jgi:hypothetical protein
MDVSKCPEDATQPSGRQVDRTCATPCQLIIPAGTSSPILKTYRIPEELTTPETEKYQVQAAAKKLFLEPSMPFQISYNGQPWTIKRMVLYHPCPVKIENVQYDAVLQLGDAPPFAPPGTSGIDDIVILIPLAGSNTPDEAGSLFQRFAPFIPSLADTATGDTLLTGGTTLASKEQQARCAAAEDIRYTRWDRKGIDALAMLKRRMIDIARAGGDPTWQRVTPEKMTAQLERNGWTNIDPREFAKGSETDQLNWVKGHLEDPYGEWVDHLPPELVVRYLRDDKKLFYKGEYLWDWIEAIPPGQLQWNSLYTDEDWKIAQPLLDRIRELQGSFTSVKSMRSERESKKQIDEILRLVESGIPNPDEALTPCEVLNISVGQDFSLSKLIPVGESSMVKGAYFSWAAQKPTGSTTTVGNTRVPDSTFGVSGVNTRFIVMQDPVKISSADLRSIRSLPPVRPEESGVRFTNTSVVLYRNAPPAGCKTCDTVQDFSKIKKQLMTTGKVDKALLAKYVFALLGALAMFFGVYWGLRWAMGSKGETVKNAGIYLGSMFKGVKESRPKSLPKSAEAPAALFPSEKSKVSNVIPMAVKSTPANLPAEVYRAPATTTMISGPRKRSLVSSTLSPRAARASVAGPRKRSLMANIVP